MTIRTKTVDEGARFLADRYLSAKPGQRLAGSLRPQTLEDALAMQQRRTVLLNRDVGGWKCLTPQPDGLIVAPIFLSTIQGGPTCPIVLDKQRCRIEPELAFTVTEDISPSGVAYNAQQLREKVEAHLALELILDRDESSEEVSFYEKLADCLLNQGVFIGPKVDLDKALLSDKMHFRLSYDGESKRFDGAHPCSDPFAPFIWLVNYLNGQGITLPVGAQVITGSYAGVIEVPIDTDIELEYEGLGRIDVRFFQSNDVPQN